MTANRSVIQFTGDGSRTRWDFSFIGGYIDPSHLKLFRGGAYTSAVIESGRLVVLPAAAVGETFAVVRVTPVDGALVDFSEGAAISESNLDLVARQGVLAVAEALDRAFMFHPGEQFPVDSLADADGKVLAVVDGRITPVFSETTDIAASVAAAQEAGATATTAAAAATAAAALVSGAGSYTPTVGNGVARTMVAKLNECPSIEDFGGVGNNATNNAAAFLLASASGKPVLIPAGKTFYTATAPTGTYYGQGKIRYGTKYLSLPSIGASSITVTVGASGDYTTINDALTYLGDKRRQFGSTQTVTIVLQTGFLMAEQVFVQDGMDLGWVTITSVDPVVLINQTAITRTLDTEDGIIPVFGATRNSILPVIGCKFSYTSNTTSKDGVAVLFGSKALMLPGSGIQKCRNGIKSLFGSDVACYMPGLTIGGAGTGAGTVTGVDFSYAANRSLHVGFGATAGLARSNFSYSGQADGETVYVIWASNVDLYQSNISHSVGEAVYCRDNSRICCRECNVSDSYVGFHALHNAFIDARSRQASSPDYTPWIGDGAKRCGTYAVLASYCSFVDAAELMADNNVSGRALNASEGSIINFKQGTATGANTSALCAVAGGVITAEDANVSGAGAYGLYAEHGGRIAAAGCYADACGATGIYALHGGSIDFGPSDARASHANGCVSFGALAVNGSHINAYQSSFNGATRGVEARDTSSINAREATITGFTDRGASAIDGGRINVMAATITGGAGAVFGVTCRGGEVTAINAVISAVSSSGVHVSTGGIVKFNGGTGTLFQTANTITANGIIFQ